VNFNFQIKERSDIEKSEFIKMIEFDKDFNFNFGINVSTDIFNDGFNKYFLPSYGPIFKINYGRIGFSSSLMFAKRDFHFHKNDAVSFYDLNNGTTSVYDVFLKYKSMESLSYIRYSIYKRHKLNISSGIGFFIKYLYAKDGHYTLNHSDGKSVLNPVFIFSTPKLFIWGITPNIALEYALDKRIKFSIDTGVKNMDFYNVFMSPARQNVRSRPIYSFNSNINVCYYLKK